MTAVLVLLTFIAFILVEWYLVRSRRKAIESATDPPNPSDRDLFFHPGHTWVRMSPNGLAVVGVTDFASNFTGALSRVELPERGDRLQQGEPAWTLISKRKRQLPQVMPIDGKVLAVNRRLLENPDLLREAPYGEGWVLCARPRHLPERLANLLHGMAADTWMDSTRESLVSRLSPAVGTVAHDGGEWAPEFGDLLDDADWEAVRKEMFPGANHS